MLAASSVWVRLRSLRRIRILSPTRSGCLGLDLLEFTAVAPLASADL